MKNVKLAFKVFLEVLRFLKELKNKEENALSDENAARCRLRLEKLCYDMSYGRDTGWRKYLTVDDPQKLIHFARQVLKSSKLDKIENGDILEAQQAVASLKE